MLLGHENLAFKMNQPFSRKVRGQNKEEEKIEDNCVYLSEAHCKRLRKKKLSITRIVSIEKRFVINVY